MARVIKRVMDLAVSVTLLLVLWPFFLLIAVLIKVDSPGPAIFKSRRAGKDREPFIMYKFRSMREDAEDVLPEIAHLNKAAPYMVKIDDDPRVTRIGWFLRNSGIDELPQFVNVIRREMSLIGPRPQEIDKVALYTPHQRRRLEVRPGITGLWQVKARHSPSFDERVRWDLEYIDNWSLWLDLKIVLWTIVVMIRDSLRTLRSFRKAAPAPVPSTHRSDGSGGPGGDGGTG